MARSAIDQELDDANPERVDVKMKGVPTSTAGMLNLDGIIDALAAATRARQLRPLRGRNGRIDLTARLLALETAEISNQRADRTAAERQVAFVLVDHGIGRP
ncbi:MAG: hypothetical protein ABSB09_02910 [Acidimicrobiales bacterium]|jgi:hypothetical protein